MPNLNLEKLMQNISKSEQIVEIEGSQGFKHIYTKIIFMEETEQYLSLSDFSFNEFDLEDIVPVIEYYNNIFQANNWLICNFLNHFKKFNPISTKTKFI